MVMLMFLLRRLPLPTALVPIGKPRFLAHVPLIFPSRHQGVDDRGYAAIAEWLNGRLVCDM
jgi:hypothetical protein